mgnify:CR=1 FL=1
MYGVSFLAVVMLSGTCDHRIVVAGRDCAEHGLVIPSARRPRGDTPPTRAERQQPQWVAPTPAQPLPAAVVQRPVTRRNNPAQRPTVVFELGVPAGSCCDGKCPSNLLWRWRRH